MMNPKYPVTAVNFCDAIWIFNYGGTIDILSGLKSAVGSKVPIFIDGGVRTGNGVFKCWLWADYVFWGGRWSTVWHWGGGLSRW